MVFTFLIALQSYLSLSSSFSSLSSSLLSISQSSSSFTKLKNSNSKNNNDNNNNNNNSINSINNNSNMKSLSLRKRLLSDFNTKSYGPFLLSGSPNIAELLAFTGYDHIVVDMEHSPIDITDTLSMLRAIDSTRGDIATLTASAGITTTTTTTTTTTITIPTTPIVRVPSHHDVANTKRILDILRPPSGIMFPMIENAEQAKLAVSSVRYPTNGIRGCAHPFVRASLYGKDANYFYKSSYEDLLIIVQVESKDAIENIPEIGMVDGVDCIFLGPFDISCSIGKMGQFESNGEVMDLIRHAEKLVRETSEKKKQAKRRKNENDDEGEGEEEHGLILGGFRSPGRTLKEMFSDDVGYQLIAGSVDLGLIQNAAKIDLLEVRKALKAKKEKG